MDDVSAHNIITILPLPPADDTSEILSYRILYLAEDPIQYPFGDDRMPPYPRGPPSLHEKIVPFSSIPSSLQPFILHSLPAHLDGPELHIIISTRSGTLLARPFSSTVSRVLLHAGIPSTSYKTHITSSPSSIAELVRSEIDPAAQRGVSQTLILLSGDGGVVDVLSHLSKPEENFVPPTICLLALGTGNALANSSGLNDGLSKGLASVFTGRAVALPTFTAVFSPGSVGLVNEQCDREPLATNESGDLVRRGCVVCSWGLHAALVAESDTVRYRVHGDARFSMAARELLSPEDGETHRFHGRVTLRTASGERRLEGEYHQYSLMTLVSRLERRFIISPSSKALSGQAWYVGWDSEITSAETNELFVSAFDDGGHVEDSKVTYEMVKGVRIEFLDEEYWNRVCVDGYIVRLPTGGWVDVNVDEGKARVRIVGRRDE